MPRRPRKWLFVLPVLAAVAVAVLLNRGAGPPEQRDTQPPPRAVRVIEIPTADVVPRATGYGRVRPERVWEAVAEVSGRVIETHPRLRKGALLPADTLLLRIDPTEYELRVSQVEADILSSRAQLSEMEAKEANIRTSLAIEEESLALRTAEVERKQRLLDKGTLSASELEQEKRSLLAQRQAVQAQQSQLNLLPAERELLQAQLARYEAQLADARLDLARTDVQLPFRARLSEVNVEQAQYVREGQVLIKADAIDRAEVEAQIPIARMRALLQGADPIDFSVGPGGELASQLGIRARVTLRDAGGDVHWPAELARLSDTLDPETRTVGVIVSVDNPYADVVPGERPPLVKGLFVEVALFGAPRPQQVIVPRQALHGERLYLIDEGRLSIRDVTVKTLQPEYAIVAAGVTAGERLVVSDLFPAIDGMPLQAEPDPDVRARLLAAATGSPSPLEL
ncbi:MAG: efflux RND transporter periplasmic adaptor subunit [Gammaproteobacteria bacterium]|nr:efflux RND transporter periplasmic adaptor subunit [Gammaproteobacteria bacterium]